MFAAPRLDRDNVLSPPRKCSGGYATMPDVADPAPIESRVLSDLAEPRVSYVIARLERAVRQGINDRVGPYGLTTLQYTTLSVLGRRRDGLSNAQLARRSFMTPQAMGEVIEALEAAGFGTQITGGCFRPP